MAENESIAEVAERVGRDLLSFFKWKPCREEAMNKDYVCTNEEHLAQEVGHSKTHPCDASFHYKDPYTGEYIFFYVDFKSFAETTLVPSKIKPEIKKLAECISCAAHNEDWKLAHDEHTGCADIRGLLFLLNHDGLYKGNIIEKIFALDDGTENKSRKLIPDANIVEQSGSKLKKQKTEYSIKIDDLEIEEGQQIHIFTPQDVRFMQKIKDDFTMLSGGQDAAFNYDDKNQFFVPNMRNHKLSHADSETFPATIESICGGVVIIIVDRKPNNRRGTEQPSRLCIVYYQGVCDEPDEFLYIFDKLAHFQMLKKDVEIKIQLTGEQVNKSYRSYFSKAQEQYKEVWSANEVFTSGIIISCNKVEVSCKSFFDRPIVGREF